MSNNKTVNAFRWKFLERISVQGIQLIMQIVLARLLGPSYYGQLAVLMIFIILSNTFIQSGFGSSLIQIEKISEDDYDSVFWSSLGISAFLYAILFVFAPNICNFFNLPLLVDPFRVLALIIFPGAINSVQQAKLSRELEYKSVFKASLISILISGIIGIILAELGVGIWALIIQSLLNTVINCTVMWFTAGWRPHFQYNYKRVLVLFHFGWKLLVASLLDTLTQELQSLIVGKKYTTEALGFYDKGRQFPQFLISSVNSTVQTVMLSTLSRDQNCIEIFRKQVKQAIKISAFVVFPVCAGLAAVAPLLVKILLEEEWIDCVPYLQIYCISMAFFPIFTCNLQAMNALGKSGTFLKLEIIKKIYSIFFIILAVILFDSPVSLALTGVVAIIPSFCVNTLPNKKLIGYSPIEQLKDIFPAGITSIVMFVVVFIFGKMICIDGGVIDLVLQIFLGILVYVGISKFTSVDEYNNVKHALISILRRENIND